MTVIDGGMAPLPPPFFLLKNMIFGKMGDTLDHGSSRMSLSKVLVYK